mgnify:CR=1 FL=1
MRALMMANNAAIAAGEEKMNRCPALACPNSRPRSLAAAWQASVMRRDACDRGTSAVLMLLEDSFLRAVMTCVAPSVEHTTCDTGEDTDTAFLSRWFGGRCDNAIIMRARRWHVGTGR